MFRAAVLALLFTATSIANAARVENFVLLDQLGDAHELYYHQQASAIVVLVQSNGCRAVHDAIADFQGLRTAFEPLGAKFLMLNANLHDDRDSIRAEAEKLGIGVPVLDDETQLIGESLGLAQSGEILIIDPKRWEIAYRGPINENDVNHAEISLRAVVAGDKTKASNRAVRGCPIDFPQARRDYASISYTETIAPLLQAKCVVCHTEGGLGPWAMSDYAMVQGFAPMIREVLRTRRMPPWHADPHIGVWKNDKSLSVQETQTLVRWIEAGAPRGNGEDPLAIATTPAVEWPLGKPDLILAIPEYSVPATGVVDYQFPTVVNPLDHGVWIKAVTVVPGEREVVHHILAGSLDPGVVARRRVNGVFDNYLIGYAPGNESHVFPADTGVYVAPGGVFAFQLHYTPVGREALDRSRVGLYFHKDQPDNFYRQDVIVNPMLRIPPMQARHAVVAYYEFSKSALLHDLVPHSHYRGVASKFELLQTDGSRETILSVPNYDFNWQRTYEFFEPKRIDAGTKLVLTTWYDNSPANPGNPDPEREVPWGLQSRDEMLYGAFSYTYVDETTEAPIHDKALAQTTQLVGFLDKDLDGKVNWRELPEPMQKRLIQGFKALDRNGDGGLDVGEFHFFTQLSVLGGRPRG